MLNRYCVLVVLTVAVFVVGCSRTTTPQKDVKPVPGNDTSVKAVSVKTIGAWEKVPGTTVPLKPTIPNCTKGHLGAVDAVIKAQHTEDTIAIQVSWPDATKSDTHKSKVWDAAAKSYKADEDREDRVALFFDMGGDFAACMLADQEYRVDVWHWKAARTGPAGLAHDKFHIYSKKAEHKKSKEFKSNTGGKIFIARVSDEGDALYAANKTPEQKTEDRLAGYVPNAEAKGSIADVKAEAVHDGKRWTVTMTRKLNTGHDDDVVFAQGKQYKSAVACFDRSSDDHHSTAGFTLVVE